MSLFLGTINRIHFFEGNITGSNWMAFAEKFII